MSSINKKSIAKIVGILAVIAILAILIVPLLTPKSVQINGAGSSFIAPLMSSWIDDYGNVNDQVTLNYNSVGSGSGIALLKNETVYFGASDAPLSTADDTAFQNAVHIPMTVGAIVVAYNIPDMTATLKLSGDVIAGIFMGKITKWNDPAIVALNTGVTMPDKDITVAHRSDGSGTTYGFTDYLSHVNATWKTDYGTAKTIDWAVGQGGKGNEGVTNVIIQNDYSLGYIELAYAIENNIPHADLQNQNGDFVSATTSAIQKAMDNSAGSLPKGTESWSTISLVDAPGSGSYPIISFTYVIVFQDLHNLPDMATAQALYDFLWWAIHDGQKDADPLHYVALAPGVVSINVASLNGLTYNGEALTYST